MRARLRMDSRPRTIALALVLLPALALAQDRGAPQPESGDEAPPLSPAVQTRLDAPYLTDADRRALRLFHGVWTRADLEAPRLRARAALIVGALDDPALVDPAADPLDRAEAMVLRGEAGDAIALIGADESVRAVRLRAEALDALGRSSDAADLLARLAERLATRPPETPADVVDAARAAALRAELAGQQRARGGDFHALNRALATVRRDLDPFYWPALVAEAELLYSKDNRADAGKAAIEALRLNPRSAEALALLGRLAVDAFDFQRAETIAARLDELTTHARTEDAADAEACSPAAAAIRARARIREGDADGALAALQPAIDRFPQHRGVLALRAAAVALRHDPAATTRALDEFDRLSPGSHLAHFEVGRALSEARQYAPAAAHLDEAARRAPHRADPLIELGLLALQAGNDVQALDALHRAHTLDPFNTRADNSLKLVESLMGYARVESEHFTIRYTPQDEPLALEMPPLLEAMHRRVTGAERSGIDHEPPGRTHIELLPDHRAFSVRIAGITRIHTMAASTGPVIAMEAPRVGPNQSVGSYDWLRVLRHEYVHTVTLSRTNNRIPHWFTEAAAVHLEDAPRDESTCRLLAEALARDELFSLDAINLGFVRPRRPQDRPLAYAQGHWMYQYIIERFGERAPLDLMDRYARGEREPVAMRAVLGIPPDEFTRDFKAWAAHRVAEWGLAPRPGEPTIESLLAAEPAGDQGKTPDEPTPEMVARWLDAHPRHAELLELAVEYALRESRGELTDHVAALLERYADARPVAELPHRLLARRALDQQGAARRDAIPHLEFLDAREQHSAAYAAELARLYADAQDWPRALDKAGRATIVAPFDATIRELAAAIAIRAGDLDRAEHHLTQLTRIEPGQELHRRRLERLRELKAGR